MSDKREIDKILTMYQTIYNRIDELYPDVTPQQLRQLHQKGEEVWAIITRRQGGMKHDSPC